MSEQSLMGSLTGWCNIGNPPFLIYEGASMVQNSKQVHIQIRGEVFSYPKNTNLLAVAKDIVTQHPDWYQDDIVLAVCGNRLRELHHHIHEGETIKFVTTTDKNGRKAYRRSLILLMQKAADNLNPDQNIDIRVEYSLGQGYYCRVLLDHTCPRVQETDEDSPAGNVPKYDFMPAPTQTQLESLKQEMLRLADLNLPIRKRSVGTEQVRRMFGRVGLHDKEHLLKYRLSSYTNIYDLDGCQDYFYGYMVPSTGYLKYFDLLPFEEGFMLLFPDKDGKKVAPFSPAIKLFSVLKTSGNWSKKLDIPTVGALDDAIAAGRTRDIILSQEALMEEQIGEMAKRIVDTHRRCVMIAGPSSSGKTTFSHRLSVQLTAQGIHPHPFPLDSYYKGRDQVPLDANGEKDFEALDALDIDLFNENVTDLIQGREVSLPDYNFVTGKREYHDKKLQIGPDDVLVIEGIHGLNDRLSYSIPPEMKYKIYISALTQLSIDEHNSLSTTDGRLIRRIVRDARTRGTSARETIAMWDSVRRGEESNIFPYQEQADEMFNSALIYEMSVLKLYAEPLLFAIDADCPEYAEAHRLLKLLDYFLPMATEDIANNSLIREFIGGGCFGL